MPNKKSSYSGIYKYNNELIKIKKKNSRIRIIHTGNSYLYLITFLNKFIILPFFLILNSSKYNTLIIPEEGYMFLRLFSFAKKNIVIIHDYRNEFSKNYKTKLNEKIKQLYLNINFIFLNRYKIIISPSKFTKNHLIKNLQINSKKIYVIPNIINIKNIKPKYNHKFKNIIKSSNNIKTIICITSNETRKNLIFLNKIISNSKNLKFIIIGNIKNKILKKNVFYFKNITDENLVYLFKISDIFLDVSLFEGFGRCSIEAQAFKKKVICFDTIINREILNKTAVYLKKNMKISKIVTCFKSKSSFKQKLKYLKNADKYSPDKVFKNFKKEIYEL